LKKRCDNFYNRKPDRTLLLRRSIAEMAVIENDKKVHFLVNLPANVEMNKTLTHVTTAFTTVQTTPGTMPTKPDVELLD
jgi:hypothetical protein